MSYNNVLYFWTTKELESRVQKFTSNCLDLYHVDEIGNVLLKLIKKKDIKLKKIVNLRFYRCKGIKNIELVKDHFSSIGSVSLVYAVTHKNLFKYFPKKYFNHNEKMNILPLITHSELMWQNNEKKLWSLLNSGNHIIRDGFSIESIRLSQEFIEQKQYSMLKMIEYNALSNLQLNYDDWNFLY